MNLVQINTQDLFFKEINNRICTVVGTYKHSRLNKDCIVVGHLDFCYGIVQDLIQKRHYFRIQSLN